MKDKMKKKIKKITYFAVSLMIISVFAVACGKEKKKTSAVKTSEETKVETSVTENEPETSTNENSTGLKEGEMFSNLSGEPVSVNIGNRRPIAVAFSNIQTASFPVEWG